MCKWTSLREFGCWATDCGMEISEEDMWTVTWELEGRFCPWCGHRIEKVDEAVKEQAAEEAAMWVEYWKAVGF